MPPKKQRKMSDSPDAMQNETFNQTVENLRTLCEENEGKRGKMSCEFVPFAIFSANHIHLVNLNYV